MFRTRAVPGFDSGVGTDPQGAAVSGATVTLKNLETNQILTTTDAHGIYNFNAPADNKYPLTAENTGFTKKVLESVGVIADQANAVNLELEVGEVTQSVTVNGDSTPLIDTETANLSGTVTSNQIQHMSSRSPGTAACCGRAPEYPRAFQSRAARQCTA